ncbi:hypothetical protein HK101_008459 [Irineochytrium annulatum]|nr:hypothetical protein HK101_008459 [Irineochytrium annulatum]
MGESRTELIAWLNDLLQLSYSKVEQCGSGAVYCQIMDSIYRDVPISKVKFNAKHEYEYIQNYKVLQNIFDKHKIENAIPVERLAKCKMQDNLEFLQWTKKYWDQYYPGGVYDAVSRRKGEGVAAVPSRMPAKASAGAVKKASSNPSVNTVPRGAAATSRANSGTLPTNRAAPAAGHGSVGSLSNGSLAWEKEKADLEADYQRMMNEMTQQTMDLKLTVEQVEKEREFYFGKLRDIEILVQTHIESGQTNSPIVDDVFKNIQTIMYKTEDGFEIPATEEGGEEEEMY